MSIISDFELVWKPFEDKIYSYIVSNPSAQSADIQGFFNRTVRMWEDPSRTQCGFLDKYSRKEPLMGSEIRSALKEFQFGAPEEAGKVSLLPYGCASAGAGALGAIIGILLPKASLMKKVLGAVPTVVLGALLFSALGGGIAKSMYDNTLLEKSQAQSEYYRRQLQELHETICALCKKYS